MEAKVVRGCGFCWAGHTAANRLMQANRVTSLNAWLKVGNERNKVFSFLPVYIGRIALFLHPRNGPNVALGKRMGAGCRLGGVPRSQDGDLGRLFLLELEFDHFDGEGRHLVMQLAGDVLEG
jgi:hypothetical protein